MASGRLDLYREHKQEYAARTKPVLLDVGPGTYLAIDGAGAPQSEAFQAAVQAIYGVAFTIKMTRKFAGKGDYKVCHLEGLWWAEGVESIEDFMAVPKGQWRWTLLIRTPEFITKDDLAAAKEALRKKKKPPEFEDVRLRTLEEGRCVQMLHVGPYADEVRTIAAMRRFAADAGMVFRGPHHEIYLSDPRRTAPEKLRTILRMPVKGR